MKSAWDQAVEWMKGHIQHNATLRSWADRPAVQVECSTCGTGRTFSGFAGDVSPDRVEQIEREKSERDARGDGKTTPRFVELQLDRAVVRATLQCTYCALEFQRDYSVSDALAEGPGGRALVSRGAVEISRNSKEVVAVKCPNCNTGDCTITKREPITEPQYVTITWRGHGSSVDTARYYGTPKITPAATSDTKSAADCRTRYRGY